MSISSDSSTSPLCIVFFFAFAHNSFNARSLINNRPNKLSAAISASFRCSKYASRAQDPAYARSHSVALAPLLEALPGNEYLVVQATQPGPTPYTENPLAGASATTP